MMSQLDMLKVFWDQWGNHDLNYYKAYVQYGAITKDEYKEVTGSDYDQSTTTADSQAVTQ